MGQEILIGCTDNNGVYMEKNAHGWSKYQKGKGRRKGNSTPAIGNRLKNQEIRGYSNRQVAGFDEVPSGKAYSNACKGIFKVVKPDSPMTLFLRKSLIGGQLQGMTSSYWAV